MASWSRSPDLFGRIGCVLCSVFFVGPLSWQERLLTRDLERDISSNKAVSPFYSGDMPLLRRSPSPPSSDWRRFLLLLCYCPWWMEADCSRFGEGAISNKLEDPSNLVDLFCHVVLWSFGAGKLPPAGLGGEGRMWSCVYCSGAQRWWGSSTAKWSSHTADFRCCDLGQVRPPLHAFLESFFSAALQFLSSNFLAEWRLLSPWSPESDESKQYSVDRCKVLLNLLALMLIWRPFVFNTVCSRCSALSGHVPGGAVVDRVCKICENLGGDGAGRRPGLDRVFFFYSRVFSANFRDLVVLLFSSVILSVSCNPPTMQ